MQPLRGGLQRVLAVDIRGQAEIHHVQAVPLEHPVAVIQRLGAEARGDGYRFLRDDVRHRDDLGLRDVLVAVRVLAGDAAGPDDPDP